jgi:ABC-type spermidine/putrescine transport system permease subunit I
MTYRSASLAFGMILAMATGFFVTPRMIGGAKYDFASNAILSYIDLGHFDEASALAVLFLICMLFPLIAIVMYTLHRRKLITGR